MGRTAWRGSSCESAAAIKTTSRLPRSAARAVRTRRSNDRAEWHALDSRAARPTLTIASTIRAASAGRSRPTGTARRESSDGFAARSFASGHDRPDSAIERKGRAAYAGCRRLPPVRSSIRGERDRAAGMGLTVQIVALRKRARRHLRRPAAANAIVRPALGRDDPRDSDVTQALVRFGTVCIVKALPVLNPWCPRGRRFA